MITNGRTDTTEALLARALPALGAWLVVGAAALLFARGTIDGSRSASIAAGIALLIVALAGHAYRDSRARLWPPAACVLLAAGAVSWYVLAALRPGPGRPADAGATSLLWAAWLAVLGMLVLVVSGVLPIRAREGSRFVPGLAALAAAAAVTVVVALVVVPAQTGYANTEAVTTDAPLPRVRPPSLTGHVAWRGDYVANTIAGPVVASRYGIGVVDPRSGRLRWRYQRWDRIPVGVLGPGRPAFVAASPDGDTVALQAVRTTGKDRSRQLLVFDARTGRLRHDEPSPHGDLVTITAGHRLVFAAKAHAAGAAGATLSAYSPDGTRAWSTRIADGCTADQSLSLRATTLTLEQVAGVAEQDDRKLVLDDCDAGLVAVDTRTGTTLWTRRPPAGDVFDAVPAPSGARHVLVRLAATGGGRLEDQQFVRYATFRVSDGHTAWRVPNPSGWPRLPSVHAPPEPHRCANAAAGTTLLVVTQCAHVFKDIRVTAYRQDTGRVAWRRTIHTAHGVTLHQIYASRFAIPVAVLPDGRVVIGYQPWHGAGCRLVVLDRTGRTVRELRRPAFDGDECAGALLATHGLLLASPYDFEQWTALD